MDHTVGYTYWIKTNSYFGDNWVSVYRHTKCKLISYAVSDTVFSRLKIGRFTLTVEYFNSLLSDSPGYRCRPIALKNIICMYFWFSLKTHRQFSISDHSSVPGHIKLFSAFSRWGCLSSTLLSVENTYIDNVQHPRFFTISNAFTKDIWYKLYTVKNARFYWGTYTYKVGTHTRNVVLNDWQLDCMISRVC